jgi:WD40 repeat protein
MAASAGATIELEHAIGLNGSALCPLHMLGQGSSACAYASGASVVLADMADPHRQHFLRGHDDAVSCLAVSASGRLAASGQRGANADVIVWDLEARAPLYRLQEHDDGVTTVAFSDDDRFLVTVGELTDGKMVVWDLHTGGVVVNHRRVEKDGTRPRCTSCVCWGGRKKDAKRRDTTLFQLATGGEGLLQYWTLDPAAGALLAQDVNTGVHRYVTSVAFSFDREYLYAGSSSGDFMAVNVKTAVMHSVTAACSNSVSVLVTLPPVPRGEGELLDRVLVGGGDGSVSVWIGDGRVYHCATAAEPALPGCVSALSLHAPDAPPGAPVRAVAVTQRGLVFELTLAPFGDASNAQRLLQEHHCGPVRAVAYGGGQSASFVTACEDGGVRLWDASTYGVASKGQLQVMTVGRPLCVGFTGEVALTGWEDGKLRAHDVEDGALLWVLDHVHRGGVCALGVSHNGKFLVTGGGEGDVRVWEIRTRQMIRHLKEHSMAVTAVVIAQGDDKVSKGGGRRERVCGDEASRRAGMEEWGSGRAYRGPGRGVGSPSAFSRHVPTTSPSPLLPPCV